MVKEKSGFLKNGFTAYHNLISDETVLELRNLYDELLLDKKRTEGLRTDLAGELLDSDKKIERITQIMRPSLIEPRLLNSIAYKKSLQIVKEFLGNDIELDFDMLINKAPFTDTETPWHQDAAYWIAMPDKRAVSCWIALDDVFEENGCMWFIPKGEKEAVLKHKNLPNGGALYCETDMENANCVPLKAGSCTFHNGFTLHYSKGNTTSSQRRALILNFRPKDMIALERKQGIDHTGERKTRN